MQKGRTNSLFIVAEKVVSEIRIFGPEIKLFGSLTVYLVFIGVEKEFQKLENLPVSV